MARNVQCSLYLGPYHFTNVVSGPLPVDYTALGLAPGQLPFLAHRIRARGLVLNGGHPAVNVILEPDGVNPHTSATIRVVPALEVNGTMDVDVYAIYGMTEAQETD